MKEAVENLEGMQEAKKVSLKSMINVLYQLVLQRYQLLTAISGISFAVVGVLISTSIDFVQNRILALCSLALLAIVAIVGLGRHLFLVRSDIKAIMQKIRELPDQDWSTPLKEKTFDTDYWPEVLYVVLIIGIILFCTSLI